MSQFVMENKLKPTQKTTTAKATRTGKVRIWNLLIRIILDRVFTLPFSSNETGSRKPVALHSLVEIREDLQTYRKWISITFSEIYFGAYISKWFSKAHFWGFKVACLLFVCLLFLARCTQRISYLKQMKGDDKPFLCFHPSWNCLRDNLTL